MCVELRIHFLLLNAVMVAPELAEVEGTQMEDAPGGRTLKLLRDMLAGWAQDASARCAPPRCCDSRHDSRNDSCHECARAQCLADLPEGVSQWLLGWGL